MYLIGCIPVARKDKNSGRSVLDACGDQLSKGVSVFFFPEGTRTRTGQVQDFKIGAFKLASERQAVIIPITILGTGALMPPGEETTLYQGGCRVIVHPAILPTDSTGVPRPAEALLREAFEVISAPCRNTVLPVARDIAGPPSGTAGAQQLQRA